MALVVLDTNCASHPKHLEAGAEACWLWAMAIGWSKMHLTDGLVPATVLANLGRFDTPITTLVERLVAVQLLERINVDDVTRLHSVTVPFCTHKTDRELYRVHDFLEHNLPAKEVRRRRDQNAKRQQKWRKKQQRVSEPLSPPRRRVTGRVTNASVTCVSPMGTYTVLEEDRTTQERTGEPRTETPVRTWPGGALHSTHRSHAECGAVCLPAFLFQEFVARTGQPEPDAYVRGWAQGVLARAQAAVDRGEVIGADPIRWWRAEWQAAHGGVRTGRELSQAQADAEAAKYLEELKGGR